MAGADHHRRQRDRILTAARPLFAQRGFDNVTVADIAEAAGTSRATVFNQFGSKAGLVEATLAGVMSFYESMVDQALDSDETTGNLIVELFRQMGAGIKLDRDYFRGIFREVARLQVGMNEGDAGQVALARARRSLEQLFERGIVRGDVDGRHAPAMLALSVNALSNATITEWLYDGSGSDLEELMVDAAGVIVAAIEVRS
ncbi:MAG: TetR/AcrR family transcriptional regulator [Actinomycetota bacterium]